jgi:hypothetical protein
MESHASDAIREWYSNSTPSTTCVAPAGLTDAHENERRCRLSKEDVLGSSS